MSRKHYNIQVFRDAERHTQLCGLEPRSGVSTHLPETEPEDRADEEKLSDQVSAGPERWVGSLFGRCDPLGKGVRDTTR
jgi:hypothetical protein